MSLTESVRHFRAVLAILCWLVALPVLAADEGDALAVSSGGQTAELTVLWVASPGWAGLDPDGQPQGVAIEIIQRFAAWLDDEHGLPVRLNLEQESDWRRFYQRVRDGRGGLFGLGNVTITEARAEELAFSPPYVNNVAVLVSHRDVARVERPEDLAEAFADQRALAFADTLHEQRLQALADGFWPDMPIDRTGANDEILAAAAAGSHFGYIDGYHFFRATDEGQPIRRHPAFDDPGEQFGIIMPLDNDWQPLLAAFFAADGGLMNTDWYRAALVEHLGPGVAAMLAR
ncbi:MAG: substrate-binding periplasmic protein [Wenzhouxiangella sp.]